MRIVVSYPLDSLGPAEGEPALFTWRWYHSVTGIGLWLVLILAMILPKANRTPKTLLILVPLTIVFLGWSVVQSQMGMGLSEDLVWGTMVYTLAVGSAVLWLLAHCLAARAWYKTLLVAIIIAMGVALVGGLSLVVESDERTVAMVFVGIVMLATVAGYALGAWGYGARHTCRFLVFQAAGTLAASLVGLFVGAWILWSVLTGGPSGFDEWIVKVTVVSLVVGFIVFLIAVPFTILGLYSPFFRQRLILLLTPSSPAAGRSSPSSSKA